MEMQGAFLSDHMAQKRLSAYLEKHLESSRHEETKADVVGEGLESGALTFADDRHR
jgi:hypothetical protein